jgi:hypothetical protein
MKDRVTDPTALELVSLCRQGAELGGQWPLARLERLAQALAAPSDGVVAWSASASAACRP